MSATSRRLLYWSPRIICILFALFISMFALDVFGEHLPFWQLMLGLTMHLVPTFLLLIVLALAWKWEWIGGVGFAALGVFYIVTAWGRFPLSVYFVIAGPAFVLAILFFANWMKRRELHGSA